MNILLPLKIIKRGWFVFPCKPDKTPYTSHGWKDATTSEYQIIRWWAKFPNALVGIACSKSGIFVVDIDDPKSWDNFVHNQNLQYIHRGPIQSTPRGGFHLVFRLPHDVYIPNNAGRLASGVDLRSNGYICTGEGYIWIGEGGIDRPLVDAPQWLLSNICKLNSLKKSQEFLLPIKKVNGLPGYFLEKAIQESKLGIRNNVGFCLALQLRDSGLTEQEAKRYMDEYWARCAQDGHPYTQAEAMSSLRAAFQRPARPPAIPGYARKIHDKH